MKKLLFGALAASALVMPSCSQEDLLIETTPKTVTVSVEAIIENEVNDARSTADDDGTFRWASGDAISVWLAGGTGRFEEFTLSETSAGETTGIFTGDRLEGEEISTYAIYPYSAEHTYANSTLTVNMPAEYGSLDKDYVENTNGIMVADIADAAATTFNFSHLAGVLRISLENMPAGAAKVVFTANTGITGKFEPVEQDGKKIITTAEPTDANKAVTINFKPLKEANTGVMQFYIPLPVGTYEGFTMAIQDQYGNQWWSKKVSKTNTISRRTMARLPKLILSSVSGSIEGTTTRTLAERIAVGGDVVVDEATEEVVDFSKITLAQDVNITLNAKVAGFNLYGSTEGKKITINVARDVEYPSFNFGYSAQGTVNDVTIIADVNSSALYNGSMQMWNGKNITIDGVRFAEGGYINSIGKATGVENLTIQNCKAVDGKRNGAFITLAQTNGLTIKNNTVKSTNLNDGNGCTYAQNQDVFTLNNAIKGNVLIEDNTIEGSLNHHAIWIANSPEAVVTIRNNRISNSYEDAIKVDQPVNISVVDNTLDAGINGVRFDNFNGTAATLTVTGNIISTHATPEDGYGIYLKNKGEIATDVILTAKNNRIGTAGIAKYLYFNIAETLTVTGDYSFPYTLEEGTRYITSENAIGLKDLAAMRWFADEVNSGNCDFAGQTLCLLDNINLNGEAWSPIGPNADANNRFRGTFDGKNKTISNLNVNQGAGSHAAGLFGALCGTVKNLVIDGATIVNLTEGTPDADSGATVNGTAVVAGSMVYEYALIDNVTVRNATVSGNRYVGGIAGHVQQHTGENTTLYTTISNCTVEGNTTITSTPADINNDGSYDNGDKIGGIVGFTTGIVDNCKVVGTATTPVTIHAYRDMGGVAGYAAESSVIDCTVDYVHLVQDYSILTSEKTTVGDIIGRENSTDAVSNGTNCTANNVTRETIPAPAQ